MVEIKIMCIPVKLGGLTWQLLNPAKLSFSSVKFFFFGETAKFPLTLQTLQFTYILPQKVLNCIYTIFMYLDSILASKHPRGNLQHFPIPCSTVNSLSNSNYFTSAKKILMRKLYNQLHVSKSGIHVGNFQKITFFQIFN